MKTLIIFILSLSIFSTHVFCQKDEIIIDPIIYPCYQLSGDLSIKQFQLDSIFSGRVILQAYCDTINMTLTNLKLVFAKLRSNIDPNDSIEIRLDLKYGSWKYLEKNMDKLIKHVAYLKIEKSSYEPCNYMPIINIPIKIGSK